MLTHPETCFEKKNGLATEVERENSEDLKPTVSALRRSTLLARSTKNRNSSTALLNPEFLVSLCARDVSVEIRGETETKNL